MTRLLLIPAIMFATACEQAPPAEPTPEHAECLAKFETYASCKLAEAEQLGDAGKQVVRSVEAQRRLATGTAQGCENQLAKVAEDPCAR